MADSTTISATRSSSGALRIAGLSSGVDVDGLVKASLTLENEKVSKQQKKITKQEWTQKAYEELNSKINDFQNAYLTLSGSNDMSTKSALAARKVTVSDSSAITVTASGSVDVDNLSISAFSKATAASYTSGVMEFNDGSQIKSVTSKTTVSDLVKELNAHGANLKATKVDGKDTYKFTVNGKEISIDADKTVSELVSTVNNTKDIGAKMAFNSFTGKFELASRTTGKDSDVSIGSGDLMSAIFDGASKQAGKNASITFKDGRTYDNFTSNQFSVGGYTFAIQKDFNVKEENGIMVPADADVSVDVSSTVDTDGMVDKIKKFVNAYNETMEALYKASYTVPDKKLEPLTSDEKKTMSESEIKEYEENAKKGLLYGDKNIRNLMEDMRKLFTSTVTESGLKFRDIGIQTGAYSKETAYGKIEINETKLKNAIEQNADSVADLFASRSEAAGATKGLAVKMKEVTQSYQNNYKFKVSDSMNTKLEQLKDMLEKLKEKLEDKEDRLYQRYATMETTISTMSAQSSFLFS